MTAWAFALTAWAKPRVAEVCLELQNKHGQCPPLWLWRLWALREGRGVPIETLAGAVSVTRRWQAAVVGPLRAARVALKPPFPPFDDPAREDLRARVRAAELAAERLLIDTLEGLTGPVSAAEPAEEALRALAAAWGHTATEALIARFIADAAGDSLDQDSGKRDV